jgi:hypothetical protein
MVQSTTKISKENPKFIIIHYINIIFTSMPGSPKWSLSLRFHQQNPLYNSPEGYNNTAEANNSEVG